MDFKDKTFFATPRDNPRDSISVEIGDSKQPDVFHPQMKIARWNNEVNFSARLLHDEQAELTTNKRGNIHWKGGNVEAQFYGLEDGYEFEITLNQKPQRNVIEFSLQTKGLEFFYQPPLEQWEINKGWERPDNVVGSYAVYASANLPNVVGGKEYRAGKVGHIYRPRIVDKDGVWTWGELHIENDVLSVTIPQEFLDTAKYPVTHAAGLTFGFTSVGGSILEIASTEVPWYRAASQPASDGSLDSISIYAKGYTTAKNNCSIYSNAADNTPDSRLAYIDSTGTAFNTSTYAWCTTNLSYASITSGTKYWLGCKGTADRYKTYYDAGAANDVRYYNNTEGWPATANDNNAYSLKISIYATYTATATSTQGLLMMWT